MNTYIQGKTFHWEWRENNQLVIATITDEYTGLPYYRNNLFLETNINYFMSHAYDVKGKIYRLEDKNGNTIVEEVDRNGKYDPSEIDYEHHLKDYIRNINPNISQGNIALPLYEIFIDNIYEYGDCKIEPGDVVVDIGASLGFFSLYAHYQKCKMCYAFEPVKDLYIAINKQLKLPNFEVRNVGVDNFNGEGKFYTPKYESICTGMYNTGTDTIAEKFEVINIVDLNVGIIDYLKLDCEGSEYNIIDSMPYVYLSSIKKIAIEFHHNKGGIKLQKLINKLRSLGFNVVFRPGSFIDGDLGMIYATK